MKKHISILLLTMSAAAFAQEGRVGINTTEPKATLDVTASATDLTRTDGFIAPRLKGDELKAKDSNYTNDQTGAIVYATDASSDAGVTGKKTINVNSAGYYYFDGMVWVRMVDKYQEPWNVEATNNPAITNTQNIYQMGRIGIGNDRNILASIHIINNDISNNDDDIVIDSYGDSRTISFAARRARGTLDAPQNLQYNDKIGAIEFYPRANGAFIAPTEIRSFYRGDGTTNLSNIEFWNSGFRKMVLDENGNLGIGLNNSLNVVPSAKLHIVKAAGDLTPAIIDGCNEYADNNAATTAGLPIGALYRTGDVLKVVH